jgi:hypothetical protein
VSDDELVSLRAEANRLLTVAVNAHLATGRDGGRLLAGWRDDTLVVRLIQPVNDVSAAFSALSRSQRVTRPLGQLLRAEPEFAHEKIVYKQAIQLDGVDGARFGKFYADSDEGFVLHTDAGWYVSESDYPDTAVNYSLYLDAAADRGPLQVLPGSHRTDFEFIRGGDVDPATVREEDFVEVRADAGDVLFFHTRLLHVSGRNNSGMPRRVFLATFAPSGSLGDDPDRRNRSHRQRAEAVEEEYRSRVARGEYTDREVIAEGVAR